MKNVNREFEMNGFGVYNEDEMNQFYTVENVNGNEYRYHADGMEDIDTAAFKEYVREMMSEYYNQ